MAFAAFDHQKAQKPVFRNTVPNVFARLRRYLGFFHLWSSALGICLQSGSAISTCGAHE